MKRVELIITIILQLAFVTTASSQIFQFSQFYASPMNLGPSFCGMVEGNRIVLNYRDQWPSIPGTFVTYAVSYDQFIERMNSGIGMLIVRDQAGSGNLALTDVGLQYSWRGELLRIGNDPLYIRPGIHFKYSQRTLDFYKLIFGNQIDADGSIEPTITEIASMPNHGYIDIASSALLYTSRYWGGVTFDHMLRPNQSLYGDDAKVDLKTAVYGGAKIRLSKQQRRRSYEKDAESITFTFHYRFQSGYDQLDIGAYYSKPPFSLGVWTRGLPVVRSEQEGYGNLDAVIVLVGYRIGQLAVGYSYDFTVSPLISSTGGAHEISLNYEFNTSNRKIKKHASIPCPKF